MIGAARKEELGTIKAMTVWRVMDHETGTHQHVGVRSKGDSARANDRVEELSETIGCGQVVDGTS